ncbi:11877_t:CDS:2, partial [Gigaspora margarita]
STKDISPLTESHSPEIEHNSTQSEETKFQHEPEHETSTTSLPQDIINDDSVEILDFVETIHKEKISSEIRERNREKKLQESHNNLTPPIQSETSTMSTPESLDLKPLKELWDQNQNKSQDKSHKKKGIENITQVISDGIQNALAHGSTDNLDNILSDSNHVIEISENSSKIRLLDLAQLFDKATNAEHYAMKANQEETLCWINYGKEFIIQYNDLIKNNNGKIGEKKAKEHHMTEISTTAHRQNHVTEILPKVSPSTKPQISNSSVRTKILSEAKVSILPVFHPEKALLETEINASSASQPKKDLSKAETDSNKNRLYQYAIEHGMDPKKFSVITKAEKNRWAIGCFPADLERDIRFYRGGIERKEDTRKYHQFLTDRERLVGEELLRCGILKSGLSTAWLDDLMEEWEKIYAQFIQISFEEKTLFVQQRNVQSTPSKRQFPISVLPKDPEEKQHVIDMVLERFPYLTLKHSFKDNYFDFNRSVPCPLCDKNHKKENIRNHIEGIWGSGEY